MLRLHGAVRAVRVELLGFLFVGALLAGAEAQPRGAYTYIAIDSWGNVITGPLGEIDHAAGEPGAFVCLIKVTCGTGEHTRAFDPLMLHGFAWTGFPTGVVVSQLRDNSDWPNVHTFTCAFVHGSAVCAPPPIGGYPAPGSTYDHNCFGGTAPTAMYCLLIHE